MAIKKSVTVILSDTEIYNQLSEKYPYQFPKLLKSPTIMVKPGRNPDKPYCGDNFRYINFKVSKFMDVNELIDLMSRSTSVSKSSSTNLQFYARCNDETFEKKLREYEEKMEKLKIQKQLYEDYQIEFKYVEMTNNKYIYRAKYEFKDQWESAKNSINDNFTNDEETP